MCVCDVSVLKVVWISCVREKEGKSNNNWISANSLNERAGECILSLYYYNSIILTLFNITQS